MPTRRLLAVALFLLSAAVVAGCGDSAPTAAPAAPTEKQLNKEKMKAGPDGAPMKK